MLKQFRILIFALMLLLPFTAFGANIDIDLDSNDAVDIEYGGTNSTTAAAARTALGVGTGDSPGFTSVIFTALTEVPASPVDGALYLFANTSDGGDDDPSDIAGTTPYWARYDAGSTSYIAQWDYDGNILISGVETPSYAHFTNADALYNDYDDSGSDGIDLLAAELKSTNLSNAGRTAATVYNFPSGEGALKFGFRVIADYGVWLAPSGIEQLWLNGTQLQAGGAIENNTHSKGDKIDCETYETADGVYEYFCDTENSNWITCLNVGSEEMDSNNAAIPSVSDSDYTTDWSENGTSVISSVDTGDDCNGEGAGSCPDPSLGTYQIRGVATTSNDAIGVDLVSVYGISDGDFVKITYDAMHHDDSAGLWYCSLKQTIGASGDGLGRITFTNSATSYTSNTTYAIIRTGNSVTLDSDFFRCREGAGSDDGTFYIDNVSIKKVTTLCVGDELYDIANALKPGETTGDTTGFSQMTPNPDTFEAVTTDPENGTNHLHIKFVDPGGGAGAGAGVYLDLSAMSSPMVTGKRYQISVWLQSLNYGTSTGAVQINLDDSTAWDNTPDGTVLGEIGKVDTGLGWIEFRTIITYSSDYRYLQIIESNGDDDGEIYIDNLSIKEVMAE